MQKQETHEELSLNSLSLGNLSSRDFIELVDSQKCTERYTQNIPFGHTLSGGWNKVSEEVRSQVTS